LEKSLLTERLMCDRREMLSLGETKGFWFAGTSPQTKTISSSVPSVSLW
jgi:hypothetical protein